MSGHQVTVRSTVVVSIDGVAPRYVSRRTMPNLARLARDGASSFSASTVHPSITLPAHVSLLRGIAPDVHGITDNTVAPLDDAWPTFLRQARRSGRRTTALLNWRPIDAIVEPDAVDQRFFLDGGYDADDDPIMGRAAAALLADRADVAFVYLVSPDNAGHEHGWGSAAYHEALRASDDALGVILASLDDDVAIVVTTDHGGHGHDHQASEPIDRVTFLTLRAPGVEVGSTWVDPVSILDVAPTVAALAGFEPAPTWQGRSLLDGTTGVADHLLRMVQEMEGVSYGENVTMRSHAIQTASQLRAAGATDELQVAGLLHDIGHLLGEAGHWGRPDHAVDGAGHVQVWLPDAVVEPIRLHVDAKRFMVATDPTYEGELSQASLETLAQQGGPFSSAEADAFATEPFAADAVALRRADDAGKRVDAPLLEPDHWRDTIRRLVVAERPSPAALRDRCACPDCRDAVSGQRLLTAADAAGWSVAGSRSGRWLLRHPDHGEHLVEHVVDGVRPTAHRPIDPFEAAPVPLDSSAAPHLVAAQVLERGLALVRGLDTRSSAVLDFARTLGHVRTTNYGELFDVRAEPDAENLAYTPVALPLHTDNPYRDPVPTVQVLHCLRPAARGGSSIFTDGFAAARRLRDEDPSAFDVLSTTPVCFEYRSADVALRAERPLIERDVSGEIRAIALNHRSMQAPIADEAHTATWYRAHDRFVSLVEDPSRRIDLDLAAGDVVVFDNRRMLHARTGFDASAGRHLQGCYIDIDALRSAVLLHDR